MLLEVNFLQGLLVDDAAELLISHQSLSFGQMTLKYFWVESGTVYYPISVLPTMNDLT